MPEDESTIHVEKLNKKPRDAQVTKTFEYSKEDYCILYLQIASKVVYTTYLLTSLLHSYHHPHLADLEFAWWWQTRKLSVIPATNLLICQYATRAYIIDCFSSWDYLAHSIVSKMKK